MSLADRRLEFWGFRIFLILSLFFTSEFCFRGVLLYVALHMYEQNLVQRLECEVGRGWRTRKKGDEEKEKCRIMNVFIYIYIHLVALTFKCGNNRIKALFQSGIAVLLSEIKQPRLSPYICSVRIATWIVTVVIARGAQTASSNAIMLFSNNSRFYYYIWKPFIAISASHDSCML